MRDTRQARYAKQAEEEVRESGDGLRLGCGSGKDAVVYMEFVVDCEKAEWPLYGIF